MRLISPKNGNKFSFRARWRTFVSRQRGRKTEYSASFIFPSKKNKNWSINRGCKIDSFLNEREFKSKYGESVVYRFRGIIIGLAVYKNICQKFQPFPFPFFQIYIIFHGQKNRVYTQTYTKQGKVRRKTLCPSSVYRKISWLSFKYS